MKIAILSVLCLITVNAQAQKKKSNSEAPSGGQNFVVSREEVITDSLNHIYRYPDEAARFPGEKYDLPRFLSQSIHYPQTAVKNKIEGKVHMSFVVEKDGSLTDIKVVLGIYDCPECDAECLRVIQSMPPWIPAKKNGEIVRSSFFLPIKFSL